MKFLSLSLVLLLGTLTYAGDNVLYSFQGAPDGQLPLAGLASDPAGNFYGTTIKGGTGPCTSSSGSGCGTIFKASPSGSGWTETVLYSFQDKKDGEYPFAGLAVDASGNLYGTTSSSGPCPPACGNVFEFSASGVFTVIHKFGGGLDGGIPMSGPTVDSSGIIYGTTTGANSSDYGTVYRMSNSSGKWKLTTLYRFKGGSDGGGPSGTPLIGPDGSLYGAAFLGGKGGVIYQVYRTNVWREKVIYFFGAHGGPWDNLAFDSKGNIYGVTEDDIVYQLTPGTNGKWTEKVLHHMNQTRRHNDGWGARGGVAIDAAGNVYGVTVGGGTRDRLYHLI